VALKEMYPGMINSPETTITNNINESDTIIYVLDPARVPEPPNLMTLGTGTNAETVKVLEINDNAITVERGFQGVAKSWPAGTVIARNFTEYDYNALKENIEDLEATKETPQGAQEKADAALNSAKQYTDQEVAEVSQALAAHKAETIHQGKHSTLEATSTDDATSVTNAPLKSAGGLAVAKTAYIGEGINVRSSDKGLALSIGQGGSTGYQKWMFDREGLGVLLNANQRVRIRYELAGNRRTVYLRVLVVSFRASSTLNHKRMIEKLITFDLNDSQNINNYADNVLLKSNVDDNDLYVVSVGSNNQFDLIYNGHPDTYQDNWAIVIESLHGRFPLTPIEAVVEDIE